MKRFSLTALGLLPGIALAGLLATQGAMAETPAPFQMAQATTDEAETDKTEEEKPMTEENAEKSVDTDEFKQRMHEGDVALGVCGARVSALLWFYEASVAQGRDDLKENVASLTESREIIKKEAERRATEDKVDTSVRVMNKHSEELWDDLNKKAEGDTAEFQQAHDELVKGVKECLALFFDAPTPEEKTEEEKEGAAN